MNHQKLIQELKNNDNVFQTLLAELDSNQILWKPTPEKWCLLEVVCHLHDEEIEDFRTRTKQVIENPGLELKPIDPGGWVLQRNYIGQNYQDVLSSFLNEREESINWLLSLTNPNWRNFIIHHEVGRMTAEMFLSNWLAHDYLHMRQIIKLKYDYLASLSSGALNYAGNIWQ